MPIYEYKCIKCLITLEFQRGFGENTEPLCCGENMQRVWSSPGVLFNGSGFYSTDNRK